MTTHQAAKVAMFGQVTDKTEMRWCPYCRIRGVYPTVPTERAGGDSLDESVYDCEQCGRRTERYDPGIDHDRCRACGDFIARGLDYCDRCGEADESGRDECDRRTPWGDYCGPRCQEVAEGVR